MDISLSRYHGSINDMDISPIIRLDEEGLEEGVRVLREMREVKMAPEFS